MTIATHANWMTGSYESDRLYILRTSENSNGKDFLKKNKGIKIWKKVCIVYFSVFAFSSISDANQQSKICSKIHKILIQRQHREEPNGFIVDYNEISAGGDSYPHLDIDCDGVDDSIIRSCGAGKEGLCTLFVKLSSGKEFELEEEKFFLVRVESNIYIVQGESLSKSEAYKKGKRKFYQITNQEVKLVCQNI
jgi:hypothetical protein